MEFGVVPHKVCGRLDGPGVGEEYILDPLHGAGWYVNEHSFTNPAHREAFRTTLDGCPHGVSYRANVVAELPFVGRHQTCCIARCRHQRDIGWLALLAFIVKGWRGLAWAGVGFLVVYCGVSRKLDTRLTSIIKNLKSRRLL